MACKKECYDATVITCSDIVIRAGFTPNYPLFYIITARNNHRVQRQVTTNADGELLINMDILPPGYLVMEGFMTIEVRDGNDFLQPVLFEFGGEEYSCILVNLVKVDIENGDSSEMNVIKSSTPAVPVDPSITFETDTDFRIDLQAGQDLEYVSLKNSSPMNVTFGTTPGGSEILAIPVTSSAANVLMIHADANMSIYVGGILPNTTVKKKIS